MGTTLVKTDATRGYLKAMGNNEGPHCLASELVGTALARWFGLPTAECAILDLPAEECVDLPRGARMQPGPAFVSRHVPGRTWGGSAGELRTLVTPDDITRLVVFDTWVRNNDRHPPDPTVRRPNYANVYLADTDNPARHRLFAIDHTHCFVTGGRLTPALANIGSVQDDGTYGLFPAFAEMISPAVLARCGEALGSLPVDIVRGIVDTVPHAWDVSPAARSALVDFVRKRAAYLARRIGDGWTPRPANAVAP